MIILLCTGIVPYSSLICAHFPWTPLILGFVEVKCIRGQPSGMRSSWIWSLCLLASLSCSLDATRKSLNTVLTQMVGQIQTESRGKSVYLLSGLIRCPLFSRFKASICLPVLCLPYVSFWDTQPKENLRSLTVIGQYWDSQARVINVFTGQYPPL